MSFIREKTINELIGAGRAPDRVELREILDKARSLVGLNAREVAALTWLDDPEGLAEVFEAARSVKEHIYGARLVIFAPLYVSNLCVNECSYCAFRVGNRAIERRCLTQEEIADETACLVDQGHKRLLLVAGESYPPEGLDYVLDAIGTIYDTKRPSGEIRRVNVNIAPLEVAQLRRLKAAQIGTYQLFQESYHRDSYARVHLGGKKRDYDNRLNAIDRAMLAGIDDVGIGALFGLYRWRFELLALLQHAKHLEERFGVGPHTISVPRMESADGAPLSQDPPHRVSDEEFRQLIAILRLAVPYTGIILSTRESPEMRREALALGVSQISAGSSTRPGGYEEVDDAPGQFELGDHRSLDEVVCDVARMGYVPSFCTGCYRLGRTGQDFMEMAKPGAIRMHCDPNALSTFEEYLLDHGSPQSCEIGERRIGETLDGMSGKQRAVSTRLLERVRRGERDCLR